MLSIDPRMLGAGPSTGVTPPKPCVDEVEPVPGLTPDVTTTLK